LHMTEIPDGLHFTKTHEWVKKEEGGRVRIGLSDYAQEQLTDIAYVELPEVGADFDKGDNLGVVESVKSSDDVLSPVTGTVSDTNTELEDSPELINESPYDEGWLVVMTVEDEGDLGDLMSSDDYTAYLDSL